MINLFGQTMPVMDVLEAISLKQKVAAQNVANASTPGYTAKSVDFSQVLSARAADTPFETSLSAKFGQPGGTDLMIQSTGEPVNLQHEMVELQRNSLMFGLATRRLSTILSALRTASQIGR